MCPSNETRPFLIWMIGCFKDIKEKKGSICSHVGGRGRGNPLCS